MDLSRVEQGLRTEFVGRRLIYLTDVTSTQDVARREAEEGTPAGTAVLTEEQSRGRGRFGRPWVSPAGKNIYVTLVLRPSVERLRSLSMLAPLAIAEGVEESAGLSPSIKWPNDVLVNGRKLAGVLIENELAGGEVKYSLMGIGLNVNLDVEAEPEIAEIATSVRAELGREVPREPVLAALFNRIEALYQEDAEAVRRRWRGRLETLGREVRVTFRDQVYEGVAEDVDSDGNLVVLRPDGSRLTVQAGEVSLSS